MVVYVRCSHVMMLFFRSQLVWVRMSSRERKKIFLSGFLLGFDQLASRSQRSTFIYLRRDELNASARRFLRLFTISECGSLS